MPPGPRSDLVEAIHALYLRAGEPSVRSIADRSDVSRDTVHRVLTEERVPRWEPLANVVRALDGDPGAFAVLWRAARLAEEGTALPEPPAEASSQIRVLIADDHRLFAEAVRGVLETAGLAVVGTVDDGPAAVRVALRQRPDVVLMDVMMPGGSGIDATAAIQAADASIQVLILSAYIDREIVAQATAAGAVGYLNKTQSREELLDGIRKAASGQRVLPPENAALMGESPKPVRSPSFARGLTPREREVMTRLARGESTQAIAKAMGISRSTARSHVQSLMTKLGVHSQREAVIKAAQAGLVNVETGEWTAG